MERRKSKFHYYVLYTPAVKQAKLEAAMKEALPEGRGIVFCPCMECWRRNSGKCEIKALFPGYIFIRSDLDALEIHEFVKKHRRKFRAFIKELGLSGMYATGDTILGDSGNNGEKRDGYRLTDLTEEEAEFMDFLLDGGNANEEAGKRDEENVTPREGLLKMSYGYREDGKYIVMEGPLKAYKNRIANVNRHDRKAYLDFEVNGCVVKAGFEVKPKRYWFPEDENTPEVLSDGTEVDLRELENKMMGG